MSIKIQKKPRGKMYACIVIFPDGNAKRWKYVTNLSSFAEFLNKSHSSYKYFNVYDKGTKAYLKRFYPGNAVPKVLLLTLVIGLSLLTHKFTFSKTFNLPASSKIAAYETFSKTTFINDFNYSATIPTPLGGVKSC